MNEEYLRTRIRQDVLFGTEAAELLGVSKQQISNLVAQKKLTPIRQTKAGNLYLRQDLLEYLERKKKNNYNVAKEIIGYGTTSAVLEYFESIKDIHDHIIEVNLYFTRELAINDGYFTFEGEKKKDTLIYIMAPSCVFVLDDGDEIYINGINCGYGGRGPHGSYDVLTALGVEDIEAQKVFSAQRVHAFREEDGWVLDCLYDEDIHVEKNEIETYRKSMELEGSLYMYNDHLVMLQDTMTQFYSETKPMDFINKYSYFIPNPVSVTFYSHSEALETGHFISSSVKEIIYKIIITDVSGKELWLNYYFDENTSINRQQDIKSILDNIGDMEKDVEGQLSIRVRDWLKKKPRIIYRKKVK